MSTRRRAARSATARVRGLDSPWRIIASGIGSAVMIVLVALIAALTVIPMALGGQALTILSGSMEPSLKPGDIAVVRGIDTADVCTDVTIGQIVTYLPEPNDPTLVTHRVIGKTIGTFDDGTTCRLILQGDNNVAADEPVSPEQVRGVFMYGVPKLGWVRDALGGGDMSSLVMAVLVLLVVWILWSLIAPPRRRIITTTTGPTGGTPAPVPDPPAPAPPALSAEEYALRLRELDLRERELSLRERELDIIAPRDPAPEAGLHPERSAS